MCLHNVNRYKMSPVKFLTFTRAHRQELCGEGQYREPRTMNTVPVRARHSSKAQGRRNHNPITAQKEKATDYIALWTWLSLVLLQYTARVKGVYLEASSNNDNCRKSVSWWSQKSVIYME